MEILRFHRWFALTVFLFIVIPAVLFVFFIAKTYEISADIFIEPKPLNVTGNSYVFADFDYRLLNNQIEIIKSDRVANKADEFVREFVAKGGRCEPCEQIAPELFINGVTHKLKRPKLSADYTKERHYAKFLQNALYVDKKDNASVLDVRFTGEGSPQDLTTLFSLYLAAYKYELERINSGKASKEYDFLQGVLANAKTTLEERAKELKEFKSTNKSYDINVQVNQMLLENNRLDDTLITMNSDILGVEKQIRASQLSLPATPEYINLMSRLEKDPELSNLRRQIVSVQQDQAEWSSKLTPAHPKMIAYNEEVTRLNNLLQSRLNVFTKPSAHASVKSLSVGDMVGGSNLDINIAADIMNQRIKLEALKAKRGVLQSAVNDIQDKLTGVPEQQLEFARRKAEFDLAQEKVMNLQKRLDEAMLMKEVSANFTKVDILKRPEAPSTPTKPDIPKIIAASILLGICFSLIMVYLRAAMDKTLHWPSQLRGVLDDAGAQQISDCAVFVLPKMADKGTVRSLMEKSNFFVPEPFKRVIIHLENMGKKDKIRRIGIVPITPFPQCHLTSVALGLYLTELGNKMVMIDADHSKHSISQLVGNMQVAASSSIASGPGLSNYLSGQVSDFVDVIYPLGKTVYGSFIPAGHTMDDAGFQFSQKNLTQLETNLSPNYDFVVYSLPSMVQSFDSIAVGRNLDGVFLVVHPEKTNLDHFRRTVEELNAVNTKILAVLVQPV